MIPFPIIPEHRPPPVCLPPYRHVLMTTPVPFILLAVVFLISCANPVSPTQSSGGTQASKTVATVLSVTNGVASTFAGTGGQGNANGPAGSATFNLPCGVGIDGSGAVFVADYQNHTIRKISSGNVSTFAGSGTTGYADGQDVSASFSFPWGIAVDSSGNVFVAEQNNSRIRKISPSALVSTFVGSGFGYIDASGTSAKVANPTGMTMASDGTIYLADTGNNRIRKITSGGSVSTLAGSGSAAYADGVGVAASFNGPRGVTVDSQGNVFVSDTQNNRIRKIGSDGSVSTFAGSGSATFLDGSATSACFNSPSGLVADNLGNIFVADQGNNRIRRINSAGTVSTLVGSGGASSSDGIGVASSFYAPTGIAWDGGTTLYVTEQSGYKVRKVSLLIATN